MANNNKIGHIGVVKSISDATVEVIIRSQSACAGCHMKGACGMSENKQKIIDADRPEFDLTIGEEVTVYATMGNAMFSVIMAYVIPVIVIMTTIFILIHLEFSELIAACGGLAVTAFYYFLLYLNRKRIGEKIRFTVEKHRGNENGDSGV